MPKEEFLKTLNIGDYLKEHRKNLNLTLKEVATLTNLSLGYISRIERGSSKITQDILEKLCKIYDINIDDVAYGYSNGKRLEKIELLELLNESNIVFDNKPLDITDRIYINQFINALLNMNDEKKQSFMSIIENIANLVS